MNTTPNNSGPWCLACGYCLYALPVDTPVCPECGGVLAEVAGCVQRRVFVEQLWTRYVLLILPSVPIALVFFLAVAPCAMHGWLRSSGFSSKAGGFSHSVFLEARQFGLGALLQIPLNSRTISGTLGVGCAGEWLELEFDPVKMICNYKDSSGRKESSKAFSDEVLVVWLMQQRPGLPLAEAQSAMHSIYQDALHHAANHLGINVGSIWVPGIPSLFVGGFFWRWLCRRERRHLHARVLVSAPLADNADAKAR